MIEVLRSAQRLGLLGPRPVEEVVEHAREFVRALQTANAATDDASTVVDIGSGGGIPGLVIAADLADRAVTLVDRRQKCTDFLERSVAALGLRERVTVRCCDTRALIVAGERFDAVTARGFGPPSVTLTAAVGLVRHGGRIVISEPPAGDRWASADLERLGLTHHREGAVAVFTRAFPVPGT